MALFRSQLHGGCRCRFVHKILSSPFTLRHFTQHRLLLLLLSTVQILWKTLQIRQEEWKGFDLTRASIFNPGQLPPTWSDHTYSTSDDQDISKERPQSFADMNSFLQDWNIECNLPMEPNHDLMELLYRDGQVVAQSQSNRRLSQPNYPESIKRLQKQQFDGSSDFLGPDPTTTWIDYSVQDSFEEFSSHFLMEPTEGPRQIDHVPNQQPNPKPPMPPLRNQLSSDSSHNFEKVANFAHFSRVGSNHCSSNQVLNETEYSRASSSNGGYGSKFLGMKEVAKLEEGRKEERVETTLTSSSGRSGSSFGGTNKNSVGTECFKRKVREVEDSECQSEAAEQDSGGVKKSSSRSTRKSRAAEVHNLSERKRRDRINKKMKALQELIPHCNKTDKASMLDEAIEYLKSLQMQLQVMWTGGGMVPMMFPGMQHYMTSMGVARHPLSNVMNFHGGSTVNPSINMASTSNPNMMHTQILNPVNLQNHSFPEQFARYMGMQQSTQPMNMFGFGSQSAQSTTTIAQSGPSSGINALGNKMG